MFFPVYTLFYLTIIVNSGITTEEPIEIVDVYGIDPYVILAITIILFSIFCNYGCYDFLAEEN